MARFQGKPVSAILESIAAFDPVPQYCVPSGNGAALPLILMKLFCGKCRIRLPMRIQVLQQISRRIRKERLSEFRNLRKPRYQRNAPGPSFRMTFEFVLVAAVIAGIPADKRIRQPVLIAPFLKPTRCSPVEVNVAEESVGYIQPHVVICNLLGICIRKRPHCPCQPPLLNAKL